MANGIISNRLKNIEMTEKAKRDMLEQRKQEAAAAAAAAKEAEDPGYAAARCRLHVGLFVGGANSLTSLPSQPKISFRYICQL